MVELEMDVVLLMVTMVILELMVENGDLQGEALKIVEVEDLLEEQSADLIIQCLELLI